MAIRISSHFRSKISFSATKKDELIKLLLVTRREFENKLVQNAPAHINALSPVGYSGFRWATQQDPFWNAYFLGITLSIAKEIEESRIPIDRGTVFSYRIREPVRSPDLFHDKPTWREFIRQSVLQSEKHQYVVICDIADCYQRIYHHRLDNALRQLSGASWQAKQMMDFLSNYSQKKSYGLPVGGPASRILVELVLNMTDQILKAHRIQFCRYADDYHIFASDIDDAYEKLIFLSEKLLRNEGLSLQKAKTRILTASEFAASVAPFVAEAGEAASSISSLMSLRIKFDPYSEAAEQEYDEAKREVSKIDVLGLINEEFSKSRLHGAVARKLVSVIKHMPDNLKDNAVNVLIDNLDSCYPIFPTVALSIKAVFGELKEATRERVCETLRERIFSKNLLLRTELHAAFAARLLAEKKSSENEDALVALHEAFLGPLVRRDVILIMAKWGQFHWLADKISDYSALSPWERRAFIIASYKMSDAGQHWRERMKDSFSPFELIVRDWAAERMPNSGWNLPI